MKRTFAFTTAAALCGLLAFSASAFAAKGGNKPPSPEEDAGNNLSFPAIGADGFAIADVIESFTVPYTGDYPGLTVEEIAALEGYDWYAQKTDGNTWNAAFALAAAVVPVPVDYVDWGDKLEAVNPKVNRPTRIELALYQALDAPMTAYRMALLEYPSSLNELQGTNMVTYDSNFAAVISNAWKLGIQYCGDAIPADLSWNGTTWDSSTPCTSVPITAGVELNVGGKYIFGASQGGWKPTKLGWYRITFYVPPTQTTQVSLAEAVIGNYADFAAVTPVVLAEDEGEDDGEGAATPVVLGDLNLSYVDVEVIGGGGGGKGK